MKFYAKSKLSENMYETPEGYLICIGVAIARTGEMDYGPGETPIQPGATGKVTISREEDEVFRPKTIASFEGKDVTIMHPDDFVSPENYSELSKGIVQNVRRGKGEQSNDLIADLLIKDIVAINLVKNGLREVSCGYEAEYIETGEGKGIQKNIIGNHLALVDEGRAGSAYAINDQKGDSKMKVSEKIKAIFAKAQDEALKATDAEPEKMEKKEESKDDMGYGMDDVMKAVKDLSEQVTKLTAKPKDEMEKKATQGQPAEFTAKDDDEEKSEDADEDSMESRVKKLEMMVEKLVAKYGAEDDDMVTDDDEEKKDEESKDEAGVEIYDEEMCDEDEGELVGDAKSRAEILAPGLKANAKDIKTKALQTAYATKDGKKIIDQFTGGKKPDFKNEKWVDAVFVAASELLKVKRSAELAETRTRTTDSPSTAKGTMTPEEINKANEKFYADRSKAAH